MVLMFRENKVTKITEIAYYILIPLVIYFHMKGAKVQLIGVPVLFLGAIAFLVAKISVVRRRMYFTFGCDNMSTRMMWLYFVGYVLMIVGYIVTFSVIRVG